MSKTHEYETLAEAIEANKVKAAGKATKKHHTIREQHQAVKPLTPEQLSVKYSNRRRNGKTARDHRRSSST